MIKQAKTSEQIMREALEEIASGNCFLPEDNIAENALKEADKAESVSDSSNRELKRYFDGEAIGRAEALQSFGKKFEEIVDFLMQDYPTQANYQFATGWNRGIDELCTRVHELLESEIK